MDAGNSGVAARHDGPVPHVGEVAEEVSVNRKAMSEETFHVSHISCEGCERTIRTLLGELDGVEQVRADHRSDTVAVTFDEGSISRQAVAAELADMGYAPDET